MPETIPDWATDDDEAVAAPDWATEASADAVPEWARGETLTPESLADYQQGQPKFYQPSGSNEITTDLTSAVVNDPSQLPAAAMGAITAPGRMAYQAAADVVSKVAGQPEYGGNLAAGMRGETPPVEKFLGDVSQTNPNLAVVGKLGKSLTEMSPLAAVGMLPGWASKLAAVGFSADMIRHAPEQFQAYAEEINKPEGEQDADKLSTLKSDIIQTFAFAPAAGAGGAGKAIGKYTGDVKFGYSKAKGLTATPQAGEIGIALDNARRLTSDAPRPKGETPNTKNQTPTESAPTAPRSSPVPEPPEWAMEYAGGEMPAESSKFTEAQVPGFKPQPLPQSSPGKSKKPSQTITGSNVQTGTEMPVQAKPGEAILPSKSTTTATVTPRHLKEAKQALSQTERPPDIFDDLDSITQKPIAFSKEDFGDMIALAKGTARTRMSINKGEPADLVLKGLVLQNKKYADWTIDDLAQAMLTAGETRTKQRSANPKQVRQLAEEIAQAEKPEPSVTDWDQAAAVTRREQNSMLVGSYGAEASGGGLNPKFPVLLGGMDAVRPLETPEIVRLARELTGSVPSIKQLKRYLGVHKGGKITLDEKLFADPVQAAQVLAHELGHANDFFPEGTMKRGNLIGRVIGSTRKFMEGHHGWLRDKKLREELTALSAYWHPWDRATAPKSYRKYRDSAKELYADALSVLLNSPGLLQQKAFTFYKVFFEHLDKKPKFKEEFFALQDLLSRGPEAVLGERLKQSREGFEKGEAMLHEKIKLREASRNSFKDFLTKVRIQSLDIADFVKRRLGSKDPRQPSEFDQLYEEWKLDDNKNAADVARIYHEMIQPVVKSGLDEHAFGSVLELQRIIGGLDAYKDMQAMRQTLGPDKLAVLQKAEARLAELERQGVAEEMALDEVILPLEKAGLEFELIDRYRQLREAQGTRAELANSQGRSPILAEAELNHLLETVTPEQRTALEGAAAQFRALIFERATEARDVGIINRLTYDKTVVANKDSYAAFRPLDKIEPWVSPMLRRARGSLSDIENPFITTLLKLQSLNNLIETQRLKNSVRDQMQTMFPADMIRAEERWTGRRRESVPAKAGEGRLKVLENGKLVEYKTDPYIAKMFDRLTPTDSFWLNKILEVPFRMGIYPLIIKYNPGFLFAFNPRRDMARTIRNLYAVEGVTRRELLPNYADREVWGAVNDYLQGRPNPLAEAMIRNKAITPSWQGFAHIEREDVMADLLRRYRMAEAPHKNRLTKTLMWLPEKINQGGSFMEALPKFASYKTLIERGVGEDRAAFLVRNYAGTPNFKLKGEFANVSNSYLPFINIFLQGWRADLKLAANPKTAAGWWMQWMLQHGWQAVAVGLATAGVFGDEIKKLYEGISEYDRTNYGTLPIGAQRGRGEFGQKTVFLRFPRDETSRFFSAMTYKATKAIADQVMGNPGQPNALPTELFAFGAGVVPSPTPVLNVASGWKEYLSGRNPTDPFRNRPVIGAREFKAGGFPAVGDMMTWTLSQSGVLNLFRYNPQSETIGELVTSGLPVANRLVKVSDQGYREKQMNTETVDAKEKAKLRVKYNDAATSLVARHAWLQSLGAQKRTPEQNQLYGRLHDWKTKFYDRADEAAWNARETRDEQRKIINDINAEAEKMQKALK